MLGERSQSALWEEEKRCAWHKCDLEKGLGGGKGCDFLKSWMCNPPDRLAARCKETAKKKAQQQLKCDSNQLPLRFKAHHVALPAGGYPSSSSLGAYCRGSRKKPETADTDSSSRKSLSLNWWTSKIWLLRTEGGWRHLTCHWKW